MVLKTEVSGSDREKLDETAELYEDGEFLGEDGEIEPAVAVGEDDEIMILSPLSDDFDEKVQEAQERLLHLRHQQEQLEKQKAELEDLKRKRQKFLRGRTEATDRLTKALTMLERELFEAQKKLEQFSKTRDSFARHLEELESINPDGWPRDEMRTELSRALAAIEDARDDYTSEMARVSALVDHAPAVTAPTPVPVPVEVAADCDGSTIRAVDGQGATAAAAPADPRDFMYWLKSGFAFTLPLLIFGIFALFLLLVIF